MPLSPKVFLIASALPALAALTACGQHSYGPPVGGALSQSALEAQAVPADCKGQKTTKQYATVDEQLASGGGKLCIPAFGGFGGKVGYPDVDPSISVAITISTTNYNGMPELGSGTPILYIQLTTSSGTTFGNTIKSRGALVGTNIVPKQTYTAFGQASAFGITETLPPCFARAGKSPFGGKFSGLGSLLKGQNIPVAASGVVEIYPGKQASTKC